MKSLLAFIKKETKEQFRSGRLMILGILFVLLGVMNPAVAKRFKEKSIEGSRAKFTWGIKDGKALAALLPDFQFVEEHALTEGMAVFMPIYKLLGKIPFVRNISNKIAVLEKGKSI